MNLLDSLSFTCIDITELETINGGENFNLDFIGSAFGEIYDRGKDFGRCVTGGIIEFVKALNKFKIF